MNIEYIFKEIWESLFIIWSPNTPKKIYKIEFSNTFQPSIMVPRTLLLIYAYAQRLVVLNRQRVWTPGSHSAIPRCIFSCHNRGQRRPQLASCEQSPWMDLLNTLQCKGQSPTIKNYLGHNLNIAEVENPQHRQKALP